MRLLFEVDLVCSALYMATKGRNSRNLRPQLLLIPLALFDIHQVLFSLPIQSWKALNLCRCLAAIVGWVIVSLRPSTDLLQKNLRRLEYNSELNRSQQRLRM